MTDAISPSVLKAVHAQLQKDIGAIRAIFAAGAKVLAPNLKTAADEICAQHAAFGDAERLAVLFLLSRAKVRGTETVDYYNFVAQLHRACPRPPTDEAFLPYLSFMCTPTKKKVLRDNSPDGVKRYNPSARDVVLPPHPHNMERPPQPTRDAAKELRDMLGREGTAVPFATFLRIVKDVDGGINNADARRLFSDACVASTGDKPTDRSVVSVEALTDVCQPQLTMVRQKLRSSALVKGAMNWPVPPPPSPRASDAAGNSARRTSAPGESPRPSPRAKPTKSAALRAQLAKDMQLDPMSPCYKGEYRHIPMVPASHSKKHASFKVESEYSPRNLHASMGSARAAPAAPAAPVAAPAAIVASAE